MYTPESHIIHIIGEYTTQCEVTTTNGCRNGQIRKNIYMRCTRARGVCLFACGGIGSQTVHACRDFIDVLRCCDIIITERYNKHCMHVNKVVRARLPRFSVTFFFFFFFPLRTLVLFSFWTSRGHGRCRPFSPPPVLAFNFYRA